MEFNKNQLEAINFNCGRCQVIAGPGSGKTAVIIERTLRLIKVGYTPERIIIYTFTNKACDELKARLRKALGYLPKVNVMTLHSFSYTFLKSLYPKDIAKKIRPLMTDEQEKVVGKIIKENGFTLNTKQAIKGLSGIRNQFITKQTEIDRLRLAKVYYQYDQYLEDNNYMDFDSMVFRMVNELERNEDLRISLASAYDFIMVDECQDINNIQFKLLMYLESINHNLFMVGDPDQSIYGWRGSKMKLIMEFLDVYGAYRIDLGENYRSDKNIVDSASFMISRNNDRIDRKLTAMLPSKNTINFNVYATPEDEAYAVAEEIKKLHTNGMNYNDILILTRENADSNPIEIAFKNNNIPLSKDVISFFEKMEIKAIYNFYNLILNHDDDLAYEYIFYKPAKGIQIKKVREIAAEKNISLFEASKLVSSAKTKEFVEVIEDLTEKIKVLKPLEFFDYLLEKTKVQEYRKFNTNKIQKNIMTFKGLLINIEGPDYFASTKQYLTDVVFTKVVTNDPSGTVRTMTIHQAKGLEAPVVFMIAMTNKYGIEDFNEEERRINYVGATRAQELLYCSGYNFPNIDSNYSLRPTFYYNELRYAQKEISLNASSSVVNKKEGN